MSDPVQEQVLAARRAQILDAAAHTFAEKGYHLTTIKDIARAAGVADGTIYLYFANKPALLLAILDRMTEAVRDSVDPAELADLDLRGLVRATLGHPLRALGGEHAELFRVVLSEVMVNPVMREQFSQRILTPMSQGGELIFQQWAAQRGLPPERTRLLTRAIMGMILGLIVEWILGDETLTTHWDELPDFLADLIIDGIGDTHS